MFLSRLFKHARTKALVVLAGLSMTLGVGATISTVAATQQNDVVATHARASSDTVYVTWDGNPTNYYHSERSIDFDSNSCLPYAYFYQSGNTSVKNAEEPGLAMTKVADNLYKIALGNANYDRMVIFYCSTSGVVQSDDYGYGDAIRSTWNGADAIEIGSDLSKNDCFFLTKYNCPDGGSAGSWGRHPGYYLRGIGVNGSTAWDDAQMVAADVDTEPGNIASWSSVTISASAQYKVVQYTKAKGCDWPNKSLSGNHIHHDGGGTDNITCDTEGTYKVYYTNDQTVAINQDVTVSRYEYKDNSDTPIADVSGNTDTALSTTLNDYPFTTYAGYDITAYKIESHSGTTITPESYYPTGNVSVYAVYTAKDYTVNKHQTNGTLTVNNSGTFGEPLSISWAPENATGYNYIFNYVKIYRGTDSSTTPLKTVTSGTSTTYTMSSTYYDNIYIDLNYAKTGNPYTVTFNMQSGTGGSDSVTATYGSAMPSATMPTREGYKFDGYYSAESGGGTKYYNSDGSSARTWNIASNTTLYANWTAANYIIYVRPVVDGVEQTQWEHDGLNISASGPHLFSVYEASSTWKDFAYGYSLEGFYSTLEGGELTGPLTNSYLSAAPWSGGRQFAYAKYVRNVSNVTYYAYLAGCTAINTGTVYVQYFSASGDSGFPGTVATPQGTIDGLYSFSIPSDATAFVVNNNHSNHNECQTIDLYTGEGEGAAYANGNNMIVVNTNYGDRKQTGTWSTVLYNLQLGTDGTGWKNILMSEPTDTSGNQAEVRHVTVAPDDEYKVHMVFTGAGVGQWWYGHTWYDDEHSVGYSFLDYGTGKTNSTGDSTSIGDGYKNGVFANASTLGTHLSYSFYLNSGIIYIEDDANEKDCGYLYLASNQPSGNIRVTAQNSNGETVQSGTIISTVSGTASSVSLEFNGFSYLHKVSLYNLRNKSTSYYVSSLRVFDGTTTTTYTWDAATTGDPSIYIDLSSTDKDSTDLGPAAKLAFEVDAMINSATNKSVCDTSKAKAASICNAYDALTEDGKDAFDGAYITTWNSTKDTYSGSKKWEMTKILYQINRIADDGKSRGTRPSGVIPGAPQGNESPLTLTLWIVLGAGVLGLGAIGTAYFVSKKKKRPQA